ncbi:MAG: MSMEG_0568 family radical SAM protein [Betaproteobacteria bacterium]|nr:MSMEG_0568 family radical SAM protein [Betaproteobacteria bacterium]
MTELQSSGLRLVEPNVGAASRRGGAGPSDHKAVTIGGRTIMVPVHTTSAWSSPFVADVPDASGSSVLTRAGIPIARIDFPKAPRFYALQTLDGIPYSQIATLHGDDVLATTVLQTCIRYGNRKKSCQFCAIGQSLAAGRTITRKTPEQLAEVARAAVLLDGVKHMVMTTGTPNKTDRGAQILCESVFAVKAAVDLPIQGQCEPPDDDRWFARMKAAGIDALGMHLEAVTPEVRARIMPGKASVPLERYLDAFAAAVGIFGRGQVSTYILAGLGDSIESILSMSEKLIALGVYPFVVPFVPISGTPLEDHPAPEPAFMRAILAPLGSMLGAAGMRSSEIKAGCGKCGACSSLATYES